MGNVRVLATICVIVTALATVHTLVAFTGWDPTWMTDVRVLIHLAEGAGVLALGLAGLAGDGPSGRLGVGLAVVGSVVLAAAEGLDPTAEGLANTLFPIAPLLVGIGLVVTGVAVLRAHRATGWARIVPLALGVVYLVGLIPAVIVSGGPPAPAALIALVVVEAGWVLLGLGVLAATEKARVAVS